jgi:hypothetical protein
MGRNPTGESLCRPSPAFKDVRSAFSEVLSVAGIIGHAPRPPRRTAPSHGGLPEVQARTR